MITKEQSNSLCGYTVLWTRASKFATFNATFPGTSVLGCALESYVLSIGLSGSRATLRAQVRKFGMRGLRWASRWESDRGVGSASISM